MRRRLGIRREQSNDKQEKRKCIYEQSDSESDWRAESRRCTGADSSAYLLQCEELVILDLRFAVKYHGLYILSGFPGDRRNLLPDHGRRGSFHRNRNVLLCAGRRLSDYKDGYAGYRRNSGDGGHGSSGRIGERTDCLKGRACSFPGDAVYDDDCPGSGRHHYRRLQYHMADRGYSGRLDEKSVQIYAAVRNENSAGLSLGTDCRGGYEYYPE